MAAINTDIEVELAFLELMKPTLSEAVDTLVESGCRRVKIAPLFMAQGAHLKRDLARLMTDVRARHGEIELSLLPALGEVDSVIDAMSTWLAEHAQ